MKLRIDLLTLPLAVILAVSLGPTEATAANCEKNPNHSDCTGGDGDPGAGNEKVPSHIVFRDEPSDGMQSDITSVAYVDSTLPGGDLAVDVFIGSEANTGNIFLRTWHLDDPNTVNRKIRLNFSSVTEAAPDCNPPNEDVYRLQFLKVGVNDEIPDGIYALTEANPSQDAEMRLRFHSGDPSASQPWFLNFGGGERRLCGDASRGSSRVMVTREAVGGDPDIADEGDVWSVEGIEVNAVIACLEKAGTSPGEKTRFCGRYFMPFRFEIKPGAPQ